MLWECRRQRWQGLSDRRREHSRKGAGMNFHLHKLVLWTIPFAVPLACGGVTTATLPAPANDVDASPGDPTTDLRDANAPDTSDPIDPHYPAKHTAMPLV